ncbi:MAG: hypothetical protein NT049_19340 [Planctomycetota bacterium]|nr:hypothetical protein [Planctomycetota bacterium]
MKSIAVLLACCVVVVMTAAAAAWAAPADKGAAPEKSEVALTVYNQNFAVVKEVRTLKIDGAAARLEFKDVARDIDPTTVQFKSLTDPEGTRVLEQNYEFDLVAGGVLLQKFIDEELSVTTKQGKSFKGKLLSFDDNELVLKTKDGIAMIGRPDNVQNIELASLPEGLRTKPTLVWKVAAAKPGNQRCQVAYQTDNVSWHADYSALVSPDDTRMDLSGWVTIENRCGATFKDAAVKLIAGDVRRQPRVEAPSGGAGLFGGGGGAKVAAEAVEEKPFFEYPMYTLPSPTTLADNQIKQIELLKAENVPVTKRYVLEPDGLHAHRRYGDPDSFNVNVYVEFKNDEKSHLGMPLPKGKVRAYKRDPADANPEFVGEDEIAHVAKDEDVRLYVGDAFDVLGSKTWVEQVGEQNYAMDLARIELRNHKAEPVVVRVREHIDACPSGVSQQHRGWDLINPTVPFKKVDAVTYDFEVPVPAGGKAVLEYVILSWPPKFSRPRQEVIDAGLKQLMPAEQKQGDGEGPAKRKGGKGGK